MKNLLVLIFSWIAMSVIGAVATIYIIDPIFHLQTGTDISNLISMTLGAIFMFVFIVVYTKIKGE